MDHKLPVSLPEGYTDFFKELESWQNHQQMSIKKTWQPPQYDLLSLISQSHKPLLFSKTLAIPAQEYRCQTESLIELVSKLRPDIQPDLQKILAHLADIDFSLLPQKILETDAEYWHKLADNMGISEKLLLFVFDHALRPFLRVISEPYYQGLADDDLQSWSTPTICPVCGSKSRISRLRANDGRRFIFCDRCFSEWEARYLQCIYCGCEEPGKIKYLSIEGDDEYQLYTCEECKGYFKTYDERTAGHQTDLFLANVQTIYLDMLAQEKGYTNHDEDHIS